MLSLICFILASPLFAEAVSIKSLTSASTENLESLLSPPSVAVVFQKDCSACQQQVKELKCIEENYKVVLLGAFSSEQSLKREYLKMKSSYPAYYAGQDILKVLNVSDAATPQLILSVNGQRLISLGYKACNKLLSLLSTL